MADKKLDRRQFLMQSVGSLAGLTLAGTLSNPALGAIARGELPSMPRSEADGVVVNASIDRVPLGATGLTVSRMALGTGTVGYNNSSNQTRAGMDNFVRVFRRAWDHGVRCADMAEGYGSMPFVGESIKGLPRDQMVLLSKIWTYPDGSERVEAVRPKIEQYLRWLGTDYIDVLLLHCLSSADWNRNRTHYMEGLSRAKEDGLLRCVGVSCHDLGALRTAATEPWVDVIMARINPFGAKMDGPVEEVAAVLQTARDAGKGLIGMKIFGEGTRVLQAEREESLRYAIHRSAIHAMTLGLETVAQVDDAVTRIARITSER